MNKVILSGRLTADPEVRRTTDGKGVAKYTLAVDRRVARNDGETTADFIRCTAWEKKADFAEKYLRKGMKIMITGRIQTGSYKDKDGRTVYTTDVIVEDHEFCESKKAVEVIAEDHEFCGSKNATETTEVTGSTDWVTVQPGIDEELPFN